MQVRSNPRRIAPLLLAAAEGTNFLQPGKAGQAKLGTVRYARRYILGGNQTPSENLQVYWEQCSAETAQLWRSRLSKPIPWHPDFGHLKSRPPLYTQCKPFQIDLKMGSGLKTTLERRSTFIRGPRASAATERHSEVRNCRVLCEGGPISDAVDALELLVQRGCHLPSSLFYRVLKRCIQSRDLNLGRRIHALTGTSGYEGDSFMATHLISLYASHGRLQEAMRVFIKVPTPDAYNWATIIFAFARHGQPADYVEAIQLYRHMCQTNVKPDNCLFAAVLNACAAAKDLSAGKEVHARVLASSAKPDKFVQAGLVNMYAKCGSLEIARSLFNKLADKNVVTWTTMIAGYAQQGRGQEALTLHRIMQQEGLTCPDSVTYVCLLQACASIGVGGLAHGKELHVEIKERGLQEDLVVGGSLVNMYVKCGSLDDARRLFDKLPKKTSVAWTAMLAGYAQKGMGTQALDFYKDMRLEVLTPPDSVTYVCLLQACANVGVQALDEGRQIHAQIRVGGLEDDVGLGGSLVNMYAKCGSLEEAQIVFEKLLIKDVVTWTALIAGYGQQGMGQKALRLYKLMRQEGLTPPDSVTYVCLLQACTIVGVGALNEGKQLHAHMREQGLEEASDLGGSLVNMYAKCDSLDDARRLFDRLPKRNVTTWNAMLAGYAQRGMGEEALRLYSNMQQEGHICPDSVTYLCLLQACAALAALPLGELLHAEIEARGMPFDGSLGAALVNMYAKCGSMYNSQQIFDSLPERSIEAWGALIGGYARQGDSELVFELVDRMKSEGIYPDEITFLSVLTVCSHVGLVDKGREYFQVMRIDYGISSTMEHFMCMVDLLGRAGHLDEALQMARTMPFPPDAVVWRTLLGACQKWKNVEVGQQAFESAVSMDGKDAACYVLMSNIYASTEMWEAAKEMQVRRMKLGVGKNPGQSWWTDPGGVVHTFSVGDKSHPEFEGVKKRLEKLIPKLKREGYVSSLLDAPNDEQAELCEHSEKLAIAYALNKTAEGTTIRIVKNLRVCEDCHIATAYISKVEKRTIICRDASRFHVYSDGKCSCANYW